MITSVDKGRGVCTVYLDFSKAFDTVSCNTGRLLKYSLVDSKMYWKLAELAGLVLSSAWSPTAVLRQFTLGPVVCKIFVNYLADGAECTRNNLADDTKLGGVADAQEELFRETLTGWRNGLKENLTKGNTRSCTFGGITLCSSVGWGLTSQKTVLRRRTWGFW